MRRLSPTLALLGEMLVLVSCTRIVHDPQPPAVDRVVMPCLSLPPPATPRNAGLCVGMDEHECRDMRNARWSDYGQALGRWVALYAWPICAER